MIPWPTAIASEIQETLTARGMEAAQVFAVSCAQRATASLNLHTRMLGPAPGHAYILGATESMWTALEHGDTSGLAALSADELTALINFDAQENPELSELTSRAVEVAWFALESFASDDLGPALSASDSILALVDAAASSQLGPSPHGRVDEEYERALGDTPIVRFELAEERDVLALCRGRLDAGVIASRHRHDIAAAVTLESMLISIFHRR